MKGLSYALIVVLGLIGTSSNAQIITTYAGTSPGGGYSGDGGPATAAHMDNPVGLAMDKHGNLFIGDGSFHVIRMVDATGIIHTIAGTSVNGYSGDGGPATDAQMHQARSIAVDTGDNVYFVDYENYRVRKINPSGIISTVAGNGSTTFSGDGGPATAAGMWPGSVAVDVAGNIYVTGNNRVRKISATTGIISTIAGNGSTSLGSDGIAATASSLATPDGIAIDKAGNIYIAEYGHARVRKINASGIIYTVAGTGASLAPTLGVLATATPMRAPVGVLVDDNSNVYITDYIENGVYVVDGITGKLFAFAGNGLSGYSGDGGQALLAQVLAHYNMATDGYGNIYIADIGNKVVRRVHDNPATFVNGHLQIRNACGAISLTGSLQASDVDVYQHLQWSLVRTPSRGTASVSYYLPVTSPSTGPVAATYTPTSYGVDTFTIRVTDGMMSDTTMIVTNNYAPTSGTLTGPDTVCAGSTISLTSSEAGGTWAAGNGNATVTGGVVSGVSAGAVTISYSITNPCTPPAATKTITVKDCAMSAPTIDKIQTGITIYPNPTDNDITIAVTDGSNEPATIRVTDVTGKLLIGETVQFRSPAGAKLKLDLSKFSPGLYLVDIMHNGQRCTEKITRN